MTRLRRMASYAPVYDAFKDAETLEKFKKGLNTIKENVLDDLVGTESADSVLDKIVDKATEVDSATYDAIVDYITDHKVSEEEQPSEEEVVDIITEKVEEEVSIEEIEEEIEKMKEVNGDDGIANEYWNDRF